MNIVVITGASGGIGRQFSLQLDRGLASVDEFWLIARHKDRLQALARRLTHRTRLFCLDLAKEEDLCRFDAVLAKERPVVRMLINCAGYGLNGDCERIPAARQAGQVDVNCRALLWITRSCLPYMKPHSRILQLASSAAFLPQPGFAAYAATKAFVLRFSQALSIELARKRIYVTAVCPGPVDTDFLRTAQQYGEMPAFKKRFLARPEAVVKKALKDSAHRRQNSVFGLPSLALWAASRVLPQGFLAKTAYRMRGDLQ